jgi:hypothetical protein
MKLTLVAALLARRCVRTVATSAAQMMALAAAARWNVAIIVANAG